MHITIRGENYTIPYKYKNEYGNKTIGVFGDSFAGIAKHAKYDNIFSHEFTWIYYLGVLSNSSVDAWGVNGCSEIDLALILTLQKSNLINYDSIIIIHTSPTRSKPRIEGNKLTNLYKALATIEGLTRKKKNVLHVFWDVNHEVYKFSHKKYYIDRILKYHPNHGEINTQVGAKGVIENKNDQLGGYCHLSNRGNLILAIEINKILFSNDESS